MFIHFSFNVIAVVYNTDIVAKSQCIFLYFSHNLAHFQKFIEALFIIIDMSSVLFRTVEFQENSHLTFENLCNYVELTISAQNSTSVLSNSPKWCHTFLLNGLGEFSFSCWIAFCVINSYILTTKLILYLIL